MKNVKIAITIIAALLALLMSLQILGHAKADAHAPPSLQQLSDSPSSGLAATSPVTVNLWLMPDFQEGKVWIDGEVFGTRFPQSLLQNEILISWNIPGGHHFFGWWAGSEVVSISHKLEGAYELHLPGIDLQSKDVLNVGIVSGVVLTDTLLPQAVPPISPTSVATRTPGILLGFTATVTSETQPAVGLTGTYSITGLEVSPPRGEFVVSPAVTLTTNDTLPESTWLPITPRSTHTAPIASPSFSHSLKVYGDYSLLRLRDFSRAFTLTVPFYPFETAIDLSLTPLLVETLMPHAASATGGSVFRKLRGADYDDGKPIPYAQVGMLGQGKVRLQVQTVKDDPNSSAVALAMSFRENQRQVEHAGADLWRGGVSRLLERHLDFPSFPWGNSQRYTVGALNAHKKTIVQVLTRDMTHTVQSDASHFSTETNFELQVWQVKDWARRLIRNESDGRVHYRYSPHGPAFPAFEDRAGAEKYAFADFSSSARDDQMLQLRLGQIMLGPRDVLTLTMGNAVLISADPLPDKLADGVRTSNGEQDPDGFTVVYHGPRALWLDLHYKPQPALLIQQSMARVRGQSRRIENWFRGEVRKPGLKAGGDIEIHTLTLINLGIVLILWVSYQTTFPNRRGFIRRGRKNAPESEDAVTIPGVNADTTRKKRDWKKKTHPWLRMALMLFYIVFLLQLFHTRGWQGGVGILWDRWKEAPMPFATLMISGAFFLLLRFDRDTACRRWGWWPLWVIGLLSIFIDIWLNSLYISSIQNALNFGSATGILSGASSLAVLFQTMAFAAVLFWLNRGEQPSSPLRREDLHAFAFATIAVATFEVTDASLFAIGLLLLAWCCLSFILDRVSPLESKSDTPPPEPNHEQQEEPPQPPAIGKQEAKQNQNAGRSYSIPARVKATVGVLSSLAKATIQGGNESPAVPVEPNQQQPETSTSTSANNTPDQDHKQSTQPPKSLGEKLRRVREPLFLGLLLAVAVVLSQDPLLRNQLAPFAPSASAGQGWVILLDPASRLATTLAPFLAIVLLTALLDTILEHRRYKNTGELSQSIDTYLKAVPLAVVLFSVFMLGVGGLFLFTGALELKLSDRVIYYLTVPLLTSVWLDWESTEEEMSWDKFAGWLRTSKNWLSIILALLSILAPRIISPVTSEQVDEIIKTFQNMQF